MRWILIGLVLGALVGAMAGWGSGWHHGRTQAEHVQALQGQLSQVLAELDEVHAQRDVLENRLAVESSTRLGLEATLATVQQELGAARDQIAFFQELMPPGPAGSISIRAFDVQPRGNLLQYRVLLMRHGTNDQPFDGMLQFQAKGQAAGEPVTVMLEPARAPDLSYADVDPAGSVPTLALKFDQFQRQTGLLRIPDGLALEQVTLNVLEGQTLRVSRSIDLAAQPESG